MIQYRIKNWSKFQHFKDRKPPWIKVYNDLLDDPDWHHLDGESAKLLVMLWLVASDDPKKEGRLPDTRRLAFKLRLDESQLPHCLQRLSHWLIQADSSVISDRYQDDAPETEGEREKEFSAANCSSLANDYDDHPKTDSDQPIFQSKKGKELTGNTLEAFNQFWDTFDYKKGKAEAADAFLCVYSSDIRDDIMAGARRTAENRQSFSEKGQTPKMAQGWLSGRRWEDQTSPITSSENHDYMQGVQL